VSLDIITGKTELTLAKKIIGNEACKREVTK
jgi:hypothetical protein